jgi:hypothetical protein
MVVAVVVEAVAVEMVIFNLGHNLVINSHNKLRN